METGNDRQHKEMVVSQSIVLPELSWKLHFDSFILRLPYLFTDIVLEVGTMMTVT